MTDSSKYATSDIVVYPVAAKTFIHTLSAVDVSRRAHAPDNG